MNYRAARAIAESHARGQAIDRRFAAGHGPLSSALRRTARPDDGADGARPRWVERRLAGKGTAMTPKPAKTDHDSGSREKTPETVRADEPRRERAEGVVRADANQPIEQAHAGPRTVQTTPAAARGSVHAAVSRLEAADFRQRWTEVQTSFVDEPRRAAQQADELVAGVMTRLAETFAGERANSAAVGSRRERHH